MLIGSFLNKKLGSISNYAVWLMSRCSSMVMKVMVCVLLVLVAFWMSLFLHIILVQVLLPTQSFSWPAYLELPFRYNQEPNLRNYGNLTAVVPLSTLTTADTHCILPPPPPRFDDKTKKETPMPICSGDPLAGPAILSRGQRYSVEVELVLPDSRPNRHHGMFQVQVAMMDGSFSTISSSRRPLLVPYRSKVQRVAAALLRLPNLLMWDSFPETHTIRVAVYDNYVDDPSRPARFVQLQLLRTVNLQVESAHVHVHASFSGLRYLLHRHPLLCAVVGTLVNMTLVLAALIVLYLRRLESIEHERRQRKLAKSTLGEARKPALTAAGKAALDGPNADLDSQHRLQIHEIEVEPPSHGSGKEHSRSKKCSNHEKKKSTLKRKDSFRAKTLSTAEEKDDSHHETVSSHTAINPSAERKEVSFLRETPFPQKMGDSQGKTESVIGEMSTSVVDEPAQTCEVASKDVGCSDIPRQDRTLDHETCGCTEGCAARTSSALDDCSANLDASLRKRVIPSASKSPEENLLVHEFDIQVTQPPRQEVFVTDQLEAFETKQRDCPSLSAEAKEGDGALTPAEVGKEDDSPSPVKMKEADCPASSVKISEEDCAVSPPASPGSTSSGGSSVGDLTVLN